MFWLLLSPFYTTASIWAILKGESAQSEAWNVTHGILQAQDTPAHAKLFAATTLKGKVGATGEGCPSDLSGKSNLCADHL